MRARFKTTFAAILVTVTLALSGPVSAATLDIAAINAMDHAAFVQTFGGIFEKSPWVADQVWEKRPFANVDAMHAAMVAIVKSSPLPGQLALLQAHPDLAGKEAEAGTLTASSTIEQAGAGLNALSKPEMSQIAELNASYKKKFGFPFIIAVRMYTKTGIFFEFARRLRNETQAEYANDLQNVFIITRLRLDKLTGAS